MSKGSDRANQMEEGELVETVKAGNTSDHEMEWDEIRETVRVGIAIGVDLEGETETIRSAMGSEGLNAGLL